MTDEVKPAPEVKPDAVAPAPEEVKTETIGEVLEPKAQESKVVPEAAFLELKKANKELNKDIKDLKKLIEDGGAKEEVSADIAEIAAEHNIDPKFLKQLATAIRKDAEKDLDTKLKPFEAKDRAEKIDKAFTTHYEKAMGEMPEYADIVNQSVIKTLSLDPANANKTFAQLIEETYGGAIKGKRTLETTTHRGGKTVDEVDFNRASKDGKYLSEVLANPETKKEYNTGLIERLSAHL